MKRESVEPHMDNACIHSMQTMAPMVPTAYPNTAKRTPTGANAGEKALATMGADAAPPTLAWDPTAQRRTGL